MQSFGRSFRAAAIEEATRAVDKDDAQALWESARIVDTFGVIGELADHGVQWDAMRPVLDALDTWHDARIKHGTFSAPAKECQTAFEFALCKLDLPISVEHASPAKRRERKKNV